MFEQANKICEEAGELYASLYMAEGEQCVIDEAWDVIHATEGLLRKYSQPCVRYGLIKNRFKAQRRGDN